MANMLDTAITRLTRFCIRNVPIPALSLALYKRSFWKRSPFTVSTKRGFRLAGNTGDVVQGSIYYFGEWEPSLSGFIHERLTGQSRTFIDVGANVGYFTLLASGAMENGKIVAIEAFPSIFDKLQANVNLNEFSSEIRCENVAATSEEMPIEMYHGPSNNEGMTTSIPGKNAPSDSVTVQGRPLAKILTEEEIATARLLKMDIEGAEAEGLAGLSPALSQFPDDVEFIVEIIPSVLGDEKVRWIFDLFVQHGFFAYELDDDSSARHFVHKLPVSRPKRLHQIPVGEKDARNIVFSRLDRKSL